MRVPLLRDRVRVPLLIGNAASLLLFALMLGGLSPDPVAHVLGPFTSMVLLLGALFAPSLAELRMRMPRAVARLC